MNTSPTIRTTRSTLAVALLGALVIGLSASFALMSQFHIPFVPAQPVDVINRSLPASYAALKERQAAQVADAAIVIAPVSAVTNERYAALKERQAEAHDLTVVPAQTSARIGYAALKERQAAQVADAAIVIAPATSARDRYYEFKLRQAEERDRTTVPAQPAASGRDRYYEFKLRQAEERDRTVMPTK
jgi:hypothetical protein